MWWVDIDAFLPFWNECTAFLAPSHCLFKHGLRQQTKLLKGRKYASPLIHSFIFFRIRLSFYSVAGGAGANPKSTNVVSHFFLQGLVGPQGFKGNRVRYYLWALCFAIYEASRTKHMTLANGHRSDFICGIDIDQVKRNLNLMKSITVKGWYLHLQHYLTSAITVKIAVSVH